MLMNGIGIVGDLNGLDKFLNHAKILLKKKGQILLDSSDVIDLFSQEDGSVYLDLKKKYYGELIYQMEYDGMKSNKFKWLFIDFQTLRSHAQIQGFDCEMIFEDVENNSYLAKLELGK